MAMLTAAAVPPADKRALSLYGWLFGARAHALYVKRMPSLAV